MKNLLKFSFLLLTISFLSCSNDIDDPVITDNTWLLPKQIKTQQSYDAEPWYFYTHITTFQYDDYDRPIEIVKETYRQRADKKDTLQYRIATTLKYTLTEDMIEKTDETKTLIGYGSYVSETQKRVYNIVNNNSGIDITVDGKYKESITVTNGLVTKYNRIAYSAIPELPIHEYTEEYAYNDKADILQYKYITQDYITTERYEYDNYNGTYKHLNIPQWLFVTLLGNEGRIHNMKKIWVVGKEDGKLIPFGVNNNLYNTNDYIKELAYAPDSEWVGIWGHRTTFEYVKAKFLPAR